MSITETIYNDRDNTIDLLLKADGVAQDLSSVTRMVIEAQGDEFVVDSDVLSAAFNWDTGTIGKLTLALGAAGLPTGTFICSLVVYDPTNDDGINWGPIVLHVVD